MLNYDYSLARGDLEPSRMRDAQVVFSNIFLTVKRSVALAKKWCHRATVVECGVTSVEENQQAFALVSCVFH